MRWFPVSRHLGPGIRVEGFRVQGSCRVCGASGLVLVIRIKISNNNNNNNANNGTDSAKDECKSHVIQTRIGTLKFSIPRLGIRASG